jgi:pimeloyl-ACP methyl ester carboxylesterase
MDTATTPLPRLEPLRHVSAGVLSVTYHEAGPADGPPVLLQHGFPYDVHGDRGRDGARYNPSAISLIVARRRSHSAPIASSRRAVSPSCEPSTR